MPRFSKKLNLNTVQPKNDQHLRLNKYIANSGVCSRREADILIKSGKVTVDNKIVTELGTIVNRSAIITVSGKKISPHKNEYYILNKPKDYISTSKDEKGRKTVVDLVKESGAQYLLPLDKLDRNSTGVLILTNDGDLTYTLTKPSTRVEKVYKAVLNKPISVEKFKQLSEGVELEDGLIIPDELAILEKGNNKEIGIVIYSGKNKLIRSMFEALGYEVEYLDRTSFAGITKKNLKRGQYRKLTIREINMLKQLEKPLVHKKK